MAQEIVIPRLGWSMDEGTFGDWLIPEGSPVKEGDLLFTLEVEKGTQEIEAMDAGNLCFTLNGPQAGDTVTVGQVIGFLVEEGEEPPESPGTQTSSSVPPPTFPRPEPGPTRSSETRLPRSATHRGERGTLISPRALRTAAEHGVDWSRIQGTGRGGRIREKDILAAMATVAESVSGKTIAISRVRQTIADRMMAGVHQAAPVTLTTRVDATALVTLRESFKKQSDTPPGYTDILLKTTASTLEQHRHLTWQWTRDGLFEPEDMNLAFAVNTERGLMAPVIRKVSSLDLSGLAGQSRELVEQARAGTLRPDQLEGGVLTVTNLGAYGIDVFTPILNLPQGAILGLGRIAREPAVVDDKVVPQWQIALSLTFDHRINDGATAAAFLSDLAEAIRKLTVSSVNKTQE